MKNVASMIIGGLALLGIGTVGFRAYQAKKFAQEVPQQNIIEIEVEPKEETRK